MEHLDAAATAGRLSRGLESDQGGGDGGSGDARPADAPASAADADPPAAAGRPTTSLPYAALARLARAALDRARSWIARLIDWAGEEFDPWLKWIVFDALFALATAAVARRVAAVRPLFEAVGWT